MTTVEKLTQLRERARLAWSILRSHDGNLVAHAKRELARSLRPDADKMDWRMARGLIDAVRVFSDEGHSGFSAAFARGQLNLLYAYQPLGPLTGDRCEWVEVHKAADEITYQNNRCGHVFRTIGRNGIEEYDSEGVIFREPDGLCYQSYYSRVPIMFPYTPMRVYANVPADATEEQKAEAARLALKEASHDHE